MHLAAVAASRLSPLRLSTDFDPQDAHLHATLRRIDQLANEDVEMRVSFTLATYHRTLIDPTD